MSVWQIIGLFEISARGNCSCWQEMTELDVADGKKVRIRAKQKGKGNLLREITLLVQILKESEIIEKDKTRCRKHFLESIFSTEKEEQKFCVRRSTRKERQREIEQSGTLSLFIAFLSSGISLNLVKFFIVSFDSVVFCCQLDVFLFQSTF